MTTSSHPSTPDQTQRVPKGPASLPFPEPPSGFGRDEDIRRSREAGFAGHLTKPIDLRRREAMSRQVAS